MATVGVILLLLLPFGCFQQTIPQIPEWTEEVEGSGKTSPTGILFKCI